MEIKAPRSDRVNQFLHYERDTVPAEDDTLTELYFNSPQSGRTNQVVALTQLVMNHITQYALMPVELDDIEFETETPETYVGTLQELLQLIIDKINEIFEELDMEIDWSPGGDDN